MKAYTIVLLFFCNSVNGMDFKKTSHHTNCIELQPSNLTQASASSSAIQDDLSAFILATKDDTIDDLAAMITKQTSISKKFEAYVNLEELQAQMMKEQQEEEATTSCCW